MANHDTPQMGIFALGTASHAYLELDLRAGAEPRDLVVGLADLREPRTTIGGINLVVGLRPELWRDRVGAPAPPGLRGFDEPLVGSDGFTMPATQQDAVLWLAGARNGEPQPGQHARGGADTARRAGGRRIGPAAPALGARR
jgi:hypothetical protein